MKLFVQFLCFCLSILPGVLDGGDLVGLGGVFSTELILSCILAIPPPPSSFRIEFDRLTLLLTADVTFAAADGALSLWQNRDTGRVREGVFDPWNFVILGVCRTPAVRSLGFLEGVTNWGSVVLAFLVDGSIVREIRPKINKLYFYLVRSRKE